MCDLVDIYGHRVTFSMPDFCIFTESFRYNTQVARNTFDFLHLCHRDSSLPHWRNPWWSSESRWGTQTYKNVCSSQFCQAQLQVQLQLSWKIYSHLPQPPIRRSTEWPLLQLLTLTTTSPITSNLTELGTAQPQLVLVVVENIVVVGFIVFVAV